MNPNAAPTPVTLVVSLSLIGLLSACQSSPSTSGSAPAASPRQTTSSVRVVDAYVKESSEPGRWILAVLLRGSMGSDSAVVVGARPYVEEVPECEGLGTNRAPELKTLDALHPDALEPAPDPEVFRTFNLGWDVQLVRHTGVSDGVELAGWVTWQVGLPPYGCPFEVHAFIRTMDITVGDPQVGELADAEFYVDSFGATR